MTVKFVDVGRSKMCWEEEISTVDELSIIRAVKKRKALASKEIDASVEGTGGTIYVAGFRPVGHFFIFGEAVANG